ncbi:hypothetical protein ACTFIU_003120 [Dictyostelium citrinum]
MKLELSDIKGYIEEFREVGSRIIQQKKETITWNNRQNRIFAYKLSGPIFYASNGHIVQCVTDQNGNYIIQKFMKDSTRFSMATSINWQLIHMAVMSFKESDNIVLKSSGSYLR